MQLTPHQIQCIHSLIRDCGQMALKMAAEPFQVYEKGVADYVTTVDRALDAKLASGLMSLFPGDRIITEENAQSWQVFSQQSGPFWLIDPLDGTDDFIQRKQHYAVMVGLLEQHQPIAGWVGAPAFDRLYYGGKDWGLFEVVGDRAAVPLVPKEPAPPTIDDCLILLGYKDQRRFGEAIQQQIPTAKFDNIGSFGLKVMRVIGGEAGIYLYLNRRVKLWDTTGPLAMAKAAGLVCCDLAGNPLRFTPDAVKLDTLAHRQTIVVGWQSYVEPLLEPLQKAIAQVGLVD